MKTKVHILLALITTLLSSTLIAGEDSLILDWNVRFGGRMQTGNLSQFGINPTAGFNLYNSKFSIDLNANYNYLNIGFKAVDDLWMVANYRYKPLNRVYPQITGVYGFAHSYRIAYSTHFGLGAGVNLRQKSPGDFFRVSGFAGYFEQKFLGENTLMSPSIGTLNELSLPIKKRFHLIWDFATYHSVTDSNVWGINNTVILHFQLTKKLSFNVSQNIIYNHQAADMIKKTNTLLMFGVEYKSNK